MRRGSAIVRLGVVFAGAAGLLAAGQASAVIVGGDVGRNTSAPTGDLAGSGWQYEGQFGSFLGTAIAPNYFVTASHIGGAVGQAFTYNGQSYATTAVFDDPNSDLRIWKVDGNLGAYAPLAASGTVAGQQIVINGRGTQRGDAIVSSGGQTAGWRWGASDGARSWGVNTADGTADGGAGIGTLIKATFDGDSTLSTGDSGGGVFVNDGGAWKLAGVNYAVESTGTVDGQPVSGAALLGQSLYASSVAANRDWIGSVVGDASAYAAPSDPVGSVPEPASAGLVAVGAAALAGRRRPRK
jgi:hypothetical protein